jgi:putative addiction module component (TIGR02574 family)
MAEDPREVPLTSAQREELDRRLDEMETGGDASIPWELVVEKISRGR